MNVLMALSVTGLAFALLACDQNRQTPQAATRAKEMNVDCPSFSEVKPAHVLLMFADRSGSVQELQYLLPALQADAWTLVRKIPAATLVVVRYIATNSYSDSERVLGDAIPENPTMEPCGQFDSACHIRNRKARAYFKCQDEARERIANALQSLSPERSTHTDIWGIVPVIAETFAFYPKAYRVVYMVTDLKDTVANRMPSSLSNLEGAKIYVRMPRSSENPEKMTQRFMAFKERLSRLGAAVYAVPLDLPLPVDEIFTK